MDTGAGAIVLNTLPGPVLPQPTTKPAKNAMWMPLGITLDLLDDTRVDLFGDLPAAIDFREVGQHITKGFAGLTNFNLFCSRCANSAHKLLLALASDQLQTRCPQSFAPPFFCLLLWINCSSPA